MLEDLPLPSDADIIKVPSVLLGTGDAISGRIVLSSGYSPAENLIFDSLSLECAKWKGKIVKDSNNENKSIGITTKGNIFHTFPEFPLRNNIGANVGYRPNKIYFNIADGAFYKLEADKKTFTVVDINDFAD